MDYYEQTTIIAPEDFPVSLEEAKHWLRMDMDITRHDPLITSLIVTATDFAIKATNRIYITTDFYGFYDCFKVSTVDSLSFISIKRAPLVSISAVEIAIDGTYTAFTDYFEKKTSGFTRLIFPNGWTGADSYTTIGYPLRVTFSAGYGTAEDVPEGIKTGIKQHVAFLYENIGDTLPESGKGIPVEVKAAYKKYRIMETF
ncbi:MAG: hypothetical protein GY834_01860 [Bacteroidetes bacterium]|nr:hypothetical protein [Bacteroidota bacterium]